MSGDSFWTDTNFEPKRNSRFKVELLSNDFALIVPHYLITSATKPSFTVENKSYRFINQAQNYPGVVTWNAVDITFIDTDKNDVLSVINRFLMDGFLNISQNEAEFATDITSRNNAIEKTTYELSQVVMYALDAEGDEVETWFLDRAWIKEIKFSNLDYSNEELSTMTITLVYDWATLSFATREKIKDDGTVSPEDNKESKQVSDVKAKQNAVSNLSVASPINPSSLTPSGFGSFGPKPAVTIEYTTRHGLEFGSLKYGSDPSTSYTVQTGFLADGVTPAKPIRTIGGPGGIFGKQTYYTDKPKK